MADVYQPNFSHGRSEEERFWEKVYEGEPWECWEWHAQLARNGYGVFWFQGRRTGAHRAAYELFVGPIPEGLEIDHRCRNRACVNPAHLDVVTRSENLLRGKTTIAAKARAGHARRNAKGRFLGDG